MVSAWASSAMVLLAVLGTALMILRRRFLSVLVEGSSMEPTLHAGQRVLVRRTEVADLRRGQVVVVARPADGPPPRADVPSWLIKRVAAVPGDPIPREAVPALRHVVEPRVPAGRLVLLGDNHAASFDSRRVGYFSADTLLGTVVRPYIRSPGY
jgi:signal peptidase I